MIVKTELKKLTNYVKILLVINVNNNIKKIEDLIISIWNEDYVNGTISELVRYMNENKNVLEEINSTNLSKIVPIDVAIPVPTFIISLFSFELIK